MNLGVEVEVQIQRPTRPQKRLSFLASSIESSVALMSLANNNLSNELSNKNSGILSPLVNTEVVSNNAIPSTPPLTSSVKIANQRSRRGSVSSSQDRMKRRLTKVDASKINLAEITSMRLSRGQNEEKKKYSKIDRKNLFKFKCEGDIEKHGLVDGKHVEWRASFDKPLEQLIYPSLQRFDTDGYEERRELQAQLHGHQDFSIDLKAIGTGDINPLIEPLEYRGNAEILPSNIMFVHAPKWTVEISKPHFEAKEGNSEEEESFLNDDDDSFSAYGLKSKRYSSLYEEIDIEGENVLRKEIKEKYQEKVERDEKERIDKQNEKNMLHIQVPTKKAGLAKRLAPIIDQNGADYVYAKLRERDADAERTQKSDTNNNSVITPPNRRRTRLTDETIEEQAYNDQKRSIKNLVPPENSHLMNGLLYYRMQGQLNTYRSNQLAEIEKSKMNRLNPRVSRRFSNSFNRRFSAKIGSSSFNAMDSELIGPDQLKSLPDAQEIKFQRLMRAVNSKSTEMQVLFKENDDKSPTAKLLSKNETHLTEMERRKAQDALLFNQLDAGILPENFIKPAIDPSYVDVDLSRYGIGDKRGVCLGKCFAGLNRLRSVGLSNNRLTSLSLPTIIENICPESALIIDLSFNDMHSIGSQSLTKLFKNSKNVLKTLDLGNCGLACSDMKNMCGVLAAFSNNLEDLILPGNKISADGASEICLYLSTGYCVLKTLDLSWNTIGSSGAIQFAAALAKNDTLESLDLSSNGIGESGGQRLAASIALNRTIHVIVLAQNGLSDRTSFVVAQALKSHPTMKRLDLSLNPVGEAGARAIFRSILRGLKCFVQMKNCSYKEDKSIFNYTYPTMDNPYTLDLSEPYQRAVVMEFLSKIIDDPDHCFFENLSYKEQPKSPDMNLSLITINGKVCLKSTGDAWIVPETGTLKFSFNQSVFIPSIAQCISPSSLHVLQLIVENGLTDDDKRTWLRLLCQDIYFTVAQGQGIIDRFKANKTIGPGQLRVLDVLQSIWKYLLDTENMFDFLYSNTDAKQRRDLAYAIGLKAYKFNWSNPTGHWVLNLADKGQRAIMMQIMAINSSESEHSKMSSGREDTSQHGNWFNFRNEKFTVDKETRDIALDKDFLKALPSSGSIEFDYVSTRRPNMQVLKEISGTKFEDDDDEEENDDDEEAAAVASTTTSATATGTGTGTAADSPNLRSRASAAVTASASVATASTNSPATKFSASDAKLNKSVTIIKDDEFFEFMQTLGLSNRSKVLSSQALYTLMDLQLASTKYYFRASNIFPILDSFEESVDIQVQVIITMFSRISDLFNMDLLLRKMDIKAQQAIVQRLGYLNVINPLKISFTYNFSMKYLDNRIILIAMMELASDESADEIIEDPATELPIATLYGAYRRTLDETRPEIMRFTFSDFGIRTNNINWSRRKEMLKKFLVGTSPVDEEIFELISMFKELESSGALATGPLDVQYAAYLKSKKSNAARVVKSNKAMINAMRATTIVKPNNA